MRLILASASTGRLAVLRAAGVEPEVRVSGVDEDAITARLAGAPARTVVAELAAAKAAAVADTVADTVTGEAVVIGCDSMLQLADGSIVGKPHHPEAAAALWRTYAGAEATLLTGHCVRTVPGAAAATGTEATVVRFAAPDDAELDAYLASREPLEVAGGFTLDGLGGWFVAGVDGVPSSVVGISLPLTRRLLGELGVPVFTLWNRKNPAPNTVVQDGSHPT